jgi:hypothetical protein
MKRTLFLLAVLFSLSLTSCKHVDAKASTDAKVDTTAVDTTKVDTVKTDKTAVKVDTTKA